MRITFALSLTLAASVVGCATEPGSGSSTSGVDPDGSATVAPESTDAGSGTTASGGGSSSGPVTSPTDPSFTGADSSSGTAGGNTPMPEEVDYEFCELEWEESASVIGTTPDGPFEGRWAWFGWLTCNGDGLSPTLVLLEDPADLASAVAVSPSGGAVPTPSIEWYLFGACSPSGGWVGEGNVTTYMRTDGPWHQAGGQIEIYDTHRIFDVVDPEDPPRMHGYISIHEGEWDIEGEFTAAYCGPLSYPLGCE